MYVTVRIPKYRISKSGKLIRIGTVIKHVKVK